MPWQPKHSARHVSTAWRVAASAKSQRGFLLLTAVVLIVIAALILTVMVYLSATGNASGAGNLQSGQSLFIAGSGLEYQQRAMAQNLDWYHSSADPIVTPAQSSGSGTFAVNTYLPATELSRQLSATATTIGVYTTSRFPTPTSSPISCNPCYLQIDDDVTVAGSGQFVTYTGISGNSFTSVAQAQNINSVVQTAPSLTSRDTTVYPVTTLQTALLANCSPPAQIQIVAHPKFLAAGTINIITNVTGTLYNEEIGYTGSSLSADYKTITLTGITRCLDSSTSQCGSNVPIGHNVGDPVTPVWNDDTLVQQTPSGCTATTMGVSNQAEMDSTGAVGSTNRYERKIIQR